MNREPTGQGNGAPERGAFPACTLERLLERPPSGWTVDDLVDLCLERDIRLVTLLHVGGDGWLKALDFVPRNPEHLRDILEAGERADGSSLFRDAGIRAGASDIVLRPRVERAFLDPFSPIPALSVLCGHAGRDGAPLPASPDTIVRRAWERLRREAGVDLHAHGEVEFFLGRRPAEDEVYGASERGYHAAAPFVFGEDLRRRALATLAAMGVPLKYAHSEVGFVPAAEAEGVAWEQHEIELALAPLPEAADAVVLAQWVLRNLAHRAGLRCSFDPILRKGHAGNGLHFHFSPVLGGRHAAVRNGDGGLSDPARWLMAGLVRFGDALMAFGNRAEESFVRITQAREAPASIAWGEYDRSALVRLPILATAPDGRAVSPPTVEFRLPDGSAHPHLLLAGAAQAMAAMRGARDLDALLEATAAAAVPRGTSSPQSVTIPRNFREVAEALSWHRTALEAGGVFPPSMMEALIARLAPPAVA